MDMLLQGLELTWLHLDMNGNLLHPAIEGPNEMAVPARPDFSAGIFRRHGIVRLLDLDMTVTMDGAFGFDKAWEPAWRKRQQAGFFFFSEQPAHLFASGAVNTCVGYACLPVEKMLVLLLQAGERMALESVIFYVIYTAFDLSLVTWRIRLCGQNHSAVMFAKGLDLRVNVRIVPVCILHGRLEIIDDQGPGDTAEMPEGIFQTANEVVGGLTIDYFAVCLARKAQNYPKDMGTLALSVGPEYRRCRAEIYLCLLTGHTFHPAKRYRAILAQAFDESSDTEVTALKSVLVSKVLVDSLTGQPGFKFVLDDFAEGFALTLRPGFMGVLFNGPDGRVSGWF